MISQKFHEHDSYALHCDKIIGFSKLIPHVKTSLLMGRLLVHCRQHTAEIMRTYRLGDEQLSNNRFTVFYFLFGVTKLLSVC